MIGAAILESLPAALEACCLTDEEMEAGPEGWRDFADPFPAWVIREVGDEAESDAAAID